MSAHRSLVLLDLRGTGESAAPADPASYRCDRQIEDVEALRVHLGLDRLDLAAHSAGAALALLYAARHPDRVARLTLINPSPRPVGLDVADSDRRELAELRQGEPWFPDAFAAFARIWSGEAAAADWTAITPFTHGRWDAASQAHAAREASQRNADAAAVYYSAGALDPEAVRSAAARLRARVLLVAGEYDVALPPKRAAEYAGLFPHAELAVQPGAGHDSVESRPRPARPRPGGDVPSRPRFARANHKTRALPPAVVVPAAPAHPHLHPRTPHHRANCGHRPAATGNGRGVETAQLTGVTAAPVPAAVSPASSSRWVCRWVLCSSVDTRV
ncbi:alpha/beta hydrolase [Micromonospora sp. B11E3]|uniref:alpha/beta fold hydrolase n=1 Tax=Micromonospora sp. B11E3 TaxID=3153562 RepID=UPI00325D69D4